MRSIIRTVFHRPRSGATTVEWLLVLLVIGIVVLVCTGAWSWFHIAKTW